ncbi:MAG TPA: hypothetical protein VMR33_07660 [Candidatus Baltobacteraceae bacterium]|nr:hypothetical protein [Candidatus Baltobacteraceae bacterium]
MKFFLRFLTLPVLLTLGTSVQVQGGHSPFKGWKRLDPQLQGGARNGRVRVNR